jgi:hypothetical protein
MRIRISDPSLLAELMGSLLRSGCVAHAVSDDACAVVHVHALDAEEAGRELAFFLGAWRLPHSDVSVVLEGRP